MAQVVFKYKGISTVIDCGENEIMKNIIKKFIQKAGIGENNNIYFYTMEILISKLKKN